jgi:archaeosortase B (VPXXXP-CTERM-specific)
MPPGQKLPSSRETAPAAPPTFSGFVARLFAYLFLASLFFSLGGVHKKMGPIQRLIAATVTSGANRLGADASVEKTIIRTRNAALDINHECTGVFVLLVYATFVLAYPAPWRQRLQGIGLGIVVLTAINVGRLVLLTLIASRRPAWFAYFHEYFFQGLFIALLAILASLWTEQVRRATVGRIPA